MFDIVRNRTGFSWSFLQLTLGFGFLLSLAACKKQEQSRTSRSRTQNLCDPPGRRQRPGDAAKSQNRMQFWRSSARDRQDVVSSGDAAKTKRPLKDSHRHTR